VLESVATEVSYDLPAITTAGRYWVRGRARTRGAEVPYGFFVKHIQSWSRSPLFPAVPEHLREMAEAAVPWHTEAAVYLSDLADHLPQGLSMARRIGVHELDEKSTSIWLEEVPVRDVTWDLPLFTRAAHLLGRLAASAAVREYAGVGEFAWDVSVYLDGRLSNQVLPVLHSAELWDHPLVAGAFDADLRDRLIAAADRAAKLVEELMEFPVVTGHGDACPNNLLMREGSDDDFTLIDFGFWNHMPVGFDLAQLLVGDVQIGRRLADDIRERDEACLLAYVDGLRAEGTDLDASDVRRAHALQLMIFTGLSTVPLEHLGAEPTAELAAIAETRAEIARFSLDLLEATGG
jgi:hypothetical protein